MFGKPVTEQQLSLLNEYTEILIDPTTSLVKTMNTFKNGNLWDINYFKSGNESENQIVNDLKTQTDSFTISERLVTTANYTIESSNQYISTDLNSPPLKSKALKKQNGEPICIETLDANNSLPIPDETKKYYYGTDEDGEEFEILEGFYKQDGSIDYIIYKPNGDLNSGQDWEYFYQSNFAVLQSKFTNDISYFLTSTLIPTNLVI